MTMMFRTVKSAVEAHLASHASSGGYRVVGYNDDHIDSSLLTGANRMVQVFARSGGFPRALSSFTGPLTHDVTFSVELLAGASASVDLSVLTDPDATAGEITAALAASQKAAKVADDSFDELVEAVFQVLMANDFQDCGLPGQVGNRWSDGWKKGMPINRGESVVIPGTLDFSLRVEEDLTGLVPVAPTTDAAITVNLNASADVAGTPQEGSAVTGGG